VDARASRLPRRPGDLALRALRDEASLAALPVGWDARFDAFIESDDKRWAVEVYGVNLLNKQASDLYGVVVSLRF